MLAPLAQGCARPPLEVGLQEPPGALVRLRASARRLLLGLKEPPPSRARRLRVALDGGGAHLEKARATSLVGIPLSLASTIFFLRSSE